ncbi:putative Phospholipase C [Streptomyces viridochromogenes Tue57]|uniref:Putative Phospholipase C n=1 Tax=Streptomyces viridochromogenes Tue57 TaxID=1160705 RepID=L8P6R0_STRVR|nr:alkaline phosphatase family protein [Streptomyces viridochromogenes]ELS50992.1 putative Phospholipase C [Streptomyces viridochromogenes Tue57]
MDYYDGNTVTGLWNYAQQYAMNDRSYSSVYGPSTPGALNLVSSLGSNGKATDSPACQTRPKASGGYADRCGPGTRQPLLVVSP